MIPPPLPSRRRSTGSAPVGAPARIALLGACALVLAANAGPNARHKGDDPPLRAEPWLGSFDEARERSRVRNAPILILSILEGEQTSDRVRDEIYKGKEFAEVSQGTIVLLTNNGTHTTKKIEVETSDGKIVERTVCSVYDTPTCADHQRSQDRVYQEFHMDGEFKMPHLIGLLPDGTIHDRFFDEIQIEDAVRIAEGVKKLAGPSLTDEELTEVRGKLDQLAGFRKARLWVSAWRAATRVLEITAAPIYAETAQAGVEQALTGMREDVAHAVKRLEEGDVEGGYLRLLDLRTEHEGTPLEKDTKNTVRKLERDKRYKDAIKDVQRKLEAEELWAELEQKLAEGKERPAERLAEKLIEKFGDTPAGRRAAERYPHLVPPDPGRGGSGGAAGR